jgi:hypothetical protein
MAIILLIFYLVLNITENITYGKTAIHLPYNTWCSRYPDLLFYIRSKGIPGDKP